MDHNLRKGLGIDYKKFVVPKLCFCLSPKEQGENICRSCSIKSGVLKLSTKLTQKDCVFVTKFFLFNKGAGPGLLIYQKIDSNTDAFLWCWRHFEEYLY